MDNSNNTKIDKPIFTLITATYNAGKFLRPTIESIKSQKFKLFEWIIIDSLSTDNTQEIINENRSTIDIYISEKDTGIYDAWNKGVIRSTGEWIAFIGAGDILLDNALEDYANLIKYAGNNSKCNLISSKALILDQYGKQKKIIGKKFTSSEFINYMSISHVGAMHHKSLFKNYGLFSPEYKSSSDYEFLLRCKDYIKPLFLNQVTVKMLYGGISNSYKALYETYLIHTKYHTILKSRFLFLIAFFKLFIRNILK